MFFSISNCVVSILPEHSAPNLSIAMAAPNPAPNPNSHLLNPNQNPTNSFPVASSQRSTPTIFTACPFNPNPNHSIPPGILYPISSRPNPTAVQHSAATFPTAAGVNPTVYSRSLAPATGHVATHVPQHQQHQHRFLYTGSDVQHHARPALLPSFAVPRTGGPSAPPPLKGVPVASHAKV